MRSELIGNANSRPTNPEFILLRVSTNAIAIVNSSFILDLLPRCRLLSDWMSILIL